LPAKRTGHIAVHEAAGIKIVTGFIGGMLLGLAVFLMWPVYEHLTGEATVYRMYCTSERKDDSPCVLRDELTSVPETYKAFPDQQSVIVWIGNDAPSKLSNCAVRDALNWHCTRTDKQGAIIDQSMANGQLSETVDGNPSPGLGLFYQASRWRWWLVKLLETSGLRKQV
jgi:hypothetical protein